MAATGPPDLEFAAAQPSEAEPVPPVAGYSAWYDASDFGSIQSANGNQVSLWRDKSSAARHLAQAASTGQPYSGSWTQNGRNVLWNLLRGAYMTSPNPAFGLSAQPWTSFVVAMHDHATGQQTTWTASAGGTELGRVYYTAAGAIGIYAAGGFTSLNWDARRPRVISSLFNGASSQVGVDGRTKTTGSVANVGGATLGGTLFGFGAAEFWEGWIGEFIVYAVALTDGQIQRTEQYLMRKWGLA